MRRLVFSLALLTACGRDLDGDGARGKHDCDDLVATIGPEADETCNGIDDDCDGFVDEGVSTVAYWDRDGDGFGDLDMARRVCVMPADGTTDSTDCDDQDSTAFPGGSEACDGRDDDCDGVVDEDVQTDFFRDDDGDGHGVEGQTMPGCTPPDGFAALSDDCDDGEATAWVGAPELCDSVDNDCDGQMDEDLPPQRVYADADGDGHGDPSAPGLACGAIAGWSLDGDDCDDADATIGPHVAEIAGNGLDEDCDGWFDEIAVPDHYATLDEALEAAVDGEVVQVGAGTWTGTWDLAGRDLTLVGEGCDETVLYGDGGGSVLSMSAGHLGNLTVAGGDAVAGGGVVVFGEVDITRACIDGNHAVNGGGLAVLGGHVSVSDSRFANNAASGDGGGVWVGKGATLDVVRSAFLRDQAYGTPPTDSTELDVWGGGGGLYGAGTTTLTNVIFADCSASDPDTAAHGGAIQFRDLGDAPTLTIDNATLDGNTSRSTGQSLYIIDAVATARNILLVDHETEDRTAMYDHDYAGRGLLTVSHLAVWNNRGADLDSAYVFDAVRADPRLYDHDDSTPITSRDYRLAVGSALIDAGDPELLDPDGTRSDIGAFGGPQAPVGFAWAYAEDHDVDGMPDGWEASHGTNPWWNDGAADPDADGLVNVEELAHESEPLVGDSDGDGISDGAEADLGHRPADPRDHRPTADAGLDGWGIPNEAVQLDGSGSYDPNADDLIYTWTLTDAPTGSVVTAVDDPAAPSPSFVPDLPGTWTFDLAVSDGLVTVMDTVEVDVVDAFVVPDDGSLDEVLGLGSVIALRPGTYAANIDAAGDNLVLFGLGAREEVVLDGESAGPVIRADLGEQVTLARLTVTGGLGTNGGGISALGGAVLLSDVVLSGNRASGKGGGLYATEDVFADDVLVTGNTASQGGGLFVDVGNLSMRRGIVAYNRATVYGGGVYLQNAGAIDASALVGNEAPEGAALYMYYASDLTNVAVLDNRGAGGAIYHRSGSTVVRNTLVAWNQTASGLHRYSAAWVWSLFGAFYGNAGLDFGVAADDVGDGMGAVYADPMITLWTHDGDASDDLWAPRPDSPLVDAGQPEMTDVDGSRSDIGAWGGPYGPRSLAAFLGDRDGDGMSDGWEIGSGLDPDSDDTLADADGDGLSNGDEWDLGLDAGGADSDHDGLSDGDEVAAGGDPKDASAHRPIADAGAKTIGEAGTAVSVDGSASSDPDGDALTYAWSVSARPTGSFVSDADIVGADTATPSIVPDMHGVFTLSLVVSDGFQPSEPDTVDIAAWEELDVPGEYATIEDAVDALEPNDHIVLGEGTFVGSVDADTFSYTLEGQGSDRTVLVGPGDVSVVVVEGTSSLRPDVTIRGLTLTGGLGIDGGGIDCEDADLDLDDVLVEGNIGYQGGGISLDDCASIFTDVRVRDNVSGNYGAGVWVWFSTLDWTGGDLSRNIADDYGGLYQYVSDVTLANVAFVANQTGGQGAAIYQSSGTLTARNLTVVGNGGMHGAIYSLGTSDIRSSVFVDNVGYGLFRSGSVRMTSTDNGFDGNTSGPIYPTTIIGSGAVRAPADFVAWDPENPEAADLRLRATSPMVDADSVYFDPDGTPGDLGAWGGPDAPADWDLWLHDADGDGMADGWEDFWGYDPASAADGAADDDGDGLDAATEHAIGTDPTSLDSDLDGVDDAAEQAAGDDPTDGADHRPVAAAGIDRTGIVGSALTLDGGLSSDPDGSALTYAWALVAKPGRSAVAEDLGATSSVAFTPDTPGAYVVELVVDDGTASSEPDRATVFVAGDLSVPADYPTVGEALSAAASGATITIEAGVWPLSADLGGKDVNLVGAGSDLTVLDAEGAGAVLIAESGEDLSVAGATLTGGWWARGGAISAYNGKLTLADVVIEANAAVEGGGMYLDKTTLLGTDVTVTDNRSVRHGGGMHYRLSNGALVRAWFAGNDSKDSGGAMYVYDSKLTLQNAVLIDNVARSGASMFLTSSAGATQVDADHVTAAYNVALSAGFANMYKSKVNLTNSILFGDTRYEIYATDSSIYAQKQSLVYPLSSDTFKMYTSATAIPVTGVDGNLSADPLFTDATDDGDWTNDDLTLTSTSPAIGAGLESDGSASDLGAWGGPQSF